MPCCYAKMCDLSCKFNDEQHKLYKIKYNPKKSQIFLAIFRFSARFEHLFSIEYQLLLKVKMNDAMKKVEEILEDCSGVGMIMVE